METFPLIYAYSVYQIIDSGGVVHTLNTTFHRNRYTSITIIKFKKV